MRRAVTAKAKKAAEPDLAYRIVEADSAAFFHTSNKGLKGSWLEKELDEGFLDKPDERWSLETYRSRGQIGDEYTGRMRCYFLNKLPAGQEDPEYAGGCVAVVCVRVCVLADGGVCARRYATRVSAVAREEFESMLKEMRGVRGLVIRSEVVADHECRISIAFKRRTTTKFFSSVSDLYHYYDLYSTFKYLQPYVNGVSILTMCLRRAGNKPHLPSGVAGVLPQLVRDVSLLYPIPDSPLHDLFREGKLSIQEVAFGFSAGVFAQHFFQRLGADYDSLCQLLNPTDVAHQAVLERIRQKLRASTMREKQIWDLLHRTEAERGRGSD